jgi:hypothetical protein
MAEEPIRCAYLNAYLPLACHTEIAIGTEVTFPIRSDIQVVDGQTPPLTAEIHVV